MTTTIYFVRHAQPNYENHDDMTRELSSKGLKDRKLVTEFLMDKEIDIVLSSSYKRAVDTVRDFADMKGIDIEVMDEFWERRIDSGWIEEFNEIRHLMPWVVQFTFEDKNCIGIRKYNLFEDN